MFDIVPKGATLDIKNKETGAALTAAYVGAGWDFSGAPVDLDLVAAALAGGKLLSQTRLIYFGDKTEPGITLSEDNRSGAGDGDDESLVLDLTQVEADVDSIAIGVVAYAGADLSTVTGFKFRVVDGTSSTGTQVLEVPVTGAAAGDTVLHAATLKRGAAGWSIENVSKFAAKGNGVDAVKGFAELFQ